MEKSFGDTVRDERERRGWTQTELGEKVGLSKNSISAIEKRGTIPKVPHRDELVKVLGIREARPLEAPRNVDDLQFLVGRQVRALVEVEVERKVQTKVADIVQQLVSLPPNEIYRQLAKLALEYGVGPGSDTHGESRGERPA